MQTGSPLFVCEIYILAVSCVLGCYIFVRLRIFYHCIHDRLHLIPFSLGIRSVGLADATAFSRLPSFAGHHWPDRPSRSCLTRWLAFITPLFSTDDCTRLLGVSHRFSYQIVVCYPGDCCVVGVLELGTSAVSAGEYCVGIQNENTTHVVSSSASTLRLFCLSDRHQLSGIL